MTLKHGRSTYRIYMILMLIPLRAGKANKIHQLSMRCCCQQQYQAHKDQQQNELLPPYIQVSSWQDFIPKVDVISVPTFKRIIWSYFEQHIGVLQFRHWEPEALCTQFAVVQHSRCGILEERPAYLLPYCQLLLLLSLCSFHLLAISVRVHSCSPSLFHMFYVDISLVSISRFL